MGFPSTQIECITVLTSWLLVFSRHSTNPILALCRMATQAQSLEMGYTVPSQECYLDRKAKELQHLYQYPINMPFKGLFLPA